jgi:transposase
MTQFIPFSRDQAFLLLPDAKDWLPPDDVAYFVVAAVDRVPLGAFAVRPIPGKAQYHPRRLLALRIYAYANGIFSSRRIERATHRDLGVRYVAANLHLHPGQDTVTAFRRANRVAFEAAFLQVLLIAREAGLLRLGTVATCGTKLDANASKIRSVRYDRAKQLRAKLAADIADLTARAEAADAEARADPQALPAEIARREALKAKRLHPAGGAGPCGGRGGPARIRGQEGGLRREKGSARPPAQAARGRPAADAAVQPHRP